ncbi:hypothetical protein BC943DRAFT_123740 [Umbelopsis sp. AD052]|nr:hypothetical protein BC943DRAFT_123740 [Umbelopsis sp. AD052]
MSMLSMSRNLFSQASNISRAFSTSAVARYNVNKVILVGRMGADPEVVNLDNDRKVIHYTVATSETRSDKEGNLVKQTQWHRITSWNQGLNNFLPEKIKKGDLVYVEGKLNYRDYTDKQGVQRTRPEILQSSVKVLSTPKHSSEQFESNEQEDM